MSDTIPLSFQPQLRSLPPEPLDCPGSQILLQSVPGLSLEIFKRPERLIQPLLCLRHLLYQPQLSILALTRGHHGETA